MTNELLLLIKKHTDTLIEQTRTKPQETLEFVMNKQTQTFSFNAVTFFEVKNSVFNITDETIRLA